MFSSLRCVFFVLLFPCLLAATDVEIITNLPYNFSVASMLIWTGAAFDLAVAAANKRYAPYLNISLRFLYNASAPHNCGSFSADTIQPLAEYYYTQTNPESVYALVSSICTDQVGVESVSTEWDWLLFSNALAQDAFLDNDIAPTSIAIGGTFHGFGVLVLNLIMYYGWTHVSALLLVDAGISPFYPNIATSLANQIAQKSLNYTFVMDFPKFHYERPSMADALDYAKKQSRVVLILAPVTVAVELLLMAEAAGLANGEYVFINIQPLQQRDFGFVTQFNTPQTLNINAFRSLIFMTYRSSGRELLELNNKIVARTSEMYEGVKTGYEAGGQPLDSFAVQASYDLVDILAQLVNESYEAAKVKPYGTLMWSGRELAARMSNRTFHGLTTGDVYITEIGERMLDMDIFAFSTATNTMQTIAQWSGATQHIIWNNRTVDWPTSDGRPPPDVPLCGYSGLQGPCQPNVILLLRILLPTIIGIIATMAVILFVGYAHRPEKREWLIKHQELTTRRASDDSFESGNVKWRNRRVWSKAIPLTQNLTMESRRMLDSLVRPVHDVQHPNINPLFGLCLAESHAYLISNYCRHGSIFDLSYEMNLDWDFKYSLMTDLIDGLIFIHATLNKFHGHLQAKVCLVDERFTLRIAELDYPSIMACLTRQPVLPVSNVWTPPLAAHVTSSRESDIFAFGLLAVAIAVQGEPRRIRDPAVEHVVEIPTDVPPELRVLVGRCTAPNPKTWPRVQTIKRIFEQMESLGSVKGQKIIDRVLARYSTYTATLENAVRERSDELNRERMKCDEILQQMLPVFVVEELRCSRSMPPEYFESTTIYFSDLVGFVSWVSLVSPYRVIEMLSLIYTIFDTHISQYAVQKIETVADSYMVASGIPIKNLGDLHAAEICRMAIALMRNFKGNLAFQNGFLLRIGIHSGSCAAGVIGTKVPRYCLFGDAVNIASRMETHGEGSRIHISFATAQLLLKGEEEFTCIDRGFIPVKGKGEMQTFWLSYR